jgi:hypothetical protein
LNQNCSTVTPGQPLNFWQKVGLGAIERLHGERDVVFAIDLTDSVGLNDEGRIRLGQIIEDTLRSGDRVYIVPFANKVNPLAPKLDSLSSLFAVEYKGKAEDIQKILQTVPLQSSTTLRQTDIQNAELFSYRGLAQINQCRLTGGKAVKPQSIVWLTDAPLFTEAGINSDRWKETPANSPFRLKNSAESKERQSWLQAFPYKARTQEIKTDNNKPYQLTVVDIPATVQEFCTPAPGGKETCLVTPYLVKQLWFPLVLLTLIILGGAFWVKYLISINKKWKLKITFESDDNLEQQICYLKNKEKISIGDDSLNSINCPGLEVRAYLKREGNRVYLQPTNIEPIFYQSMEVNKREEIKNSSFRMNCPDKNNKDFEIFIQIFK